MKDNTDKHFDQTDKDDDRLDQPQTYRIQYKEHGKSYTYTETMYWENDLSHELSTYSDPAFGDRFELVSVFLVVDDGPDIKVQDVTEKDFGETRNAQSFSPDDEREFQEGWSLYPKLPDEVWEPEYLGDR